jgi:transcriptional regulator CtsR
LEHGYVVETRRGGGGYVRITVLEIDPRTDWQLLIESIGETITQQQAEGVVTRLLREGIVSEREALIMNSALDRDALNIKQPWADMLRANVLRALLAAVYRTML